MHSMKAKPFLRVVKPLRDIYLFRSMKDLAVSNCVLNTHVTFLRKKSMVATAVAKYLYTCALVYKGI